jgi:hypothetical protein
MQHEERHLVQIEIENARRTLGDYEMLLPRNLATKAPFVVKIEEKCEDCGGNGYDCGSLSPIDPEECPAFHGIGKQLIVHNYLAEALKHRCGEKLNACTAGAPAGGDRALPRFGWCADGYSGDSLKGGPAGLPTLQHHAQNVDGMKV